jgi:hypothetical protein
MYFKVLSATDSKAVVNMKALMEYSSLRNTLREGDSAKSFRR